jgi:ribonucleoside-diphosphate reductase subunit M2
MMANLGYSQAAAAIDNLKMESPVKKLDFAAANKENAEPADIAATKTMVQEPIKPVVAEAKPKEEAPKTTVAHIIKPEEADEPLLQENPQRFVLFPIKYHEVGNSE